MSNSIVIVTRGGKAHVIAHPDNVEIHVFDLDSNDLYIYQDKYICSVSGVNDDGTVNLDCVDSMDGSGDGRRFMNVPAEKVEWYADDGSSDSFEVDDDEEEYYGIPA